MCVTLSALFRVVLCVGSTVDGYMYEAVREVRINL